MTVQQQIDQFLASPAFGVIGASTNRSKFGNKILRCYLQHGYRAIPVNPNEKEIEGIACVAAMSDLPAEVKSISMITPPKVTAQLVPLALERGHRKHLDAAGSGTSGGGVPLPAAQRQRHCRRELSLGRDGVS